MKSKIIAGLLIMALALIMGVSGCNNSSIPSQSTNQIITAPTTPSANNATTVSVIISKMEFSPTPLTINMGDTINWTNMDSVPHTVTSDSDFELGSDTLRKSRTFLHTFNVTGTYDYHCTIHPSMKGKIIVK